MDFWEEIDVDAIAEDGLAYLEPELEAVADKGCHCGEKCAAHYNLT